MKVSRRAGGGNGPPWSMRPADCSASHGFDGVGVAEITRAAGLTHGGFYGQFASK